MPQDNKKSGPKTKPEDTVATSGASGATRRPVPVSTEASVPSALNQGTLGYRLKIELMKRKLKKREESRVRARTSGSPDGS